MANIRAVGMNTASAVYMNEAHDHRHVFTTTSGRALCIVRDEGDTDALYGDHTGAEKIFIFEADDTARSGWTQRAAISTGSTATQHSFITGAIFANDDLGILFRTNTGTVKYVKFTYATYALSAAETVFSFTGSEYIEDFDMTITDGNVPVVAALYHNTSTGLQQCHVKARRTSDSTWVNATTAIQMIAAGTGGKSYPCSAVSISSYGSNGTTRRLAFAWAGGTTSADQGVWLYTADLADSTGLISNLVNRWPMQFMGEVNAGIGWSQGRSVKIFRTTTPTAGRAGFTVGVQHNHVEATIGVYKAEMDTSNVYYEKTYATTVWLIGEHYDYGMAIGYGNNKLIFYSQSYHYNSGQRQVVDQTAYLDPSDHSVLWGPPGWHGFVENAAVLAGAPFEIVTRLGANGDRNNTYHVDLILSHNYLQGGQAVEQIYAVNNSIHGGSIPDLVAPGRAAQINTATPQLIADDTFEYGYPMVGIRIKWQFATDPGFTSNVKYYEQPMNRTRFHFGNPPMTFNDTLPASLRLTPGVWYYRAVTVDEFGLNGDNVSGTWSFTVAHPPSAMPLSPSNGELRAWNGGVLALDWDFYDTSSTDTQTRYQVEIRRVDTDAIVYDSNMTTSTTTGMTTPALSSTYKNVPLKWRVRVWDTDFTVGAYSPYGYFTMADPPTATITAPTQGQVVTSGIPSVTFTFTANVNTMKEYTVSYSYNGGVVWSKTVTNLNAASGTSTVVTGDKAYLVNNLSYTVNVSVKDNMGMVASATPVSVTTSWASPAAPAAITAIDLTPYNTEDQGYVKITYPDTNRDADFMGWVVYRKDELINPNTQVVVEASDYKELYVQSAVSTSGYEYHDYTAPSGYKVTYAIRQRVNRFGDIVESVNSPVTAVYPVSDGYWLIQIDDTLTSADAFRLSNVTADSFTEEWEEAEYAVIGRGRHVDRGDNYGVRGSFDAQLRDSPTQTARQKRLRILQLKEESKQLWLRNPFGDLYRVHVGNIDISRVAGVGMSEFVDITVPYLEVSE